MLVPIIIWEDENILVINKPAGLLSIRDGYDGDLPHLRSVLETHYQKLYIVHRLDRDTSGVMVLAKNAKSHKDLNTQFEKRLVKKSYHCLIEKSPLWDLIVCDTPLRVNADRNHRTLPDPTKGHKASTEFRVIQRMRMGCLIEACPESGYTHQIRTHLSSLSFPIIADKLYGYASAANPYIERLALHAYRISFLVPSTDQYLEFSAPYPDDFSAALQALDL
jgi:RluA family pseudouridine synthase